MWLILFSIMQQQDVECDYFKWRDLEICVYGQRVVLRLMEWHESLKVERELSRTNISDEVEKYKNEAKRYKNEAEKCKNEDDNARMKLRNISPN